MAPGSTPPCNRPPKMPVPAVLVRARSPYSIMSAVGDDREISNKGRSGLHRLSTGQRSLVQPIPCAFEESQNPLFSGPAACQQTVAVKVYVASQQRFLRLEQLSSLRKRVEPGPDWGQLRAPSSQYQGQGVASGLATKVCGVVKQ